MSGPKPHKVIIYATCETVVSNDDPIEAGMIARKLFEDDISSKSEMFSVRTGRVTVSPYREKRPVMRTREEISRAMRRRHRHVWGLYLQGWSQEKIADRLHVTKSRIAEILHRYIRMTNRHRRSIEGENWKICSPWSLPLRDYRTRATNQFTSRPNHSIL